MKLQFDLGNVKQTEFGVGRDADEARNYVYVPVDSGVQEALRDMVADTWTSMQSKSKEPPRYEPSEKHEGEEYLYLPLDDELSASLKALHHEVG